jgi:DNA gyrase subunit A
MVYINPLLPPANTTMSQLDLLGADERIIPTALHSEMQRSYLEYAMSVIVGRALPDVRDGLKPVHRRIMFAMHELGLTPDRPFRKCARVVGDVLGKYHPHGDQSVYDALVRLVQDFSSRYPLLGGHGNFGSIDNDPPAAMRYTETRLSGIGYEAVLGEISSDIVDFVGNFDNSQQEPTVLPAEFPVLLVNGCSGIAVGMATNIPPHNLGEIIDGTIALIDNPNLPDHELWTIIPGPDFPTGGEIIGNDAIVEAYRTGRGIIPVRGVFHIEEAAQQVKVPGKHRKRRNAIIVTELPFQVNKAGWIERIAELVNAGKIDNIADIRDESDRDGMRVVIEIKKDSDHQKVITNLYRQTALQSNFGAIFLAIVDGLPRQLSLREALQEFLKFREETLTRQYSKELDSFEQRAHIVNGITIALDNLDETIEILRGSPDGSTAKIQMVERLSLSEEQADAILAMPMRRLTGMERQNLANELAELQGKIAGLQKLLQDRKELLKSMKKDLRALRKKYADPRRTRIINAKPILPTPPAPKVPKPPVAELIAPLDAFPQESSTPLALTYEAIAESTEDTSILVEAHEIPELFPDDAPEDLQSDEILVSAPQESTTIPTATKTSPRTSTLHPRPPAKEIAREKAAARSQQISLMITPPEPAQLVELEFTRSGLVRRFNDENQRLTSTSEFVTSRRSIMSDQEIIVISDSAKAHLVKVDRLPKVSNSNQLGESLDVIIPSLDGAKIVRDLDFPKVDPSDPKALITNAIILVTAQGRVKRLSLSELTASSVRGISLIKMKDDDRLLFAVAIDSSAKELVVATSMGRLVRLTISQDQMPMQGRPSQGVQGLRVGSKEQLVNALAVQSSDKLVLLTSLGCSKQIPVTALRAVPIGSIGDQAVRFGGRTEFLTGMLVAQAGQVATVITDQARLLKMAINSSPLLNKEGAGDRLIDLEPEEQSIGMEYNC